jgi:MFS family permease
MADLQEPPGIEPTTPNPLRGLLVFVSVIVFADTALFAAITPILPDLVAQFGLSKTGAGILFGAYPAGVLVAAVPSGLMAARRGVRPTVVAGLAILAVASLGVAFAQTTVLLDLSRFMQGVGSAASWAGAFGWLAGAAPRERRGELIGTALAAAIVGALTGPVLGTAAHVAGRDVVFAATAAGGLVLMGWALRMSPPAPQGGTLRSLLRAARDARIRAAMWIVTLPGLLFGTMSVLVPLRLDELGATAFVIGGAWVVAGLGEAAVAPIVGRISDRRGRFAPAIFGVGLSAVMVALLPWPGTQWLMVALVVATAPAIGVLWTPSMALLSDGAEYHGIAQGLAFALMNVAWACGETVGAAGSAGLADATSDAVPYLLLSGICAVTVLVLRRVARRPLIAAASAREAGQAV